MKSIEMLDFEKRELVYLKKLRGAKNNKEQELIGESIKEERYHLHHEYDNLKQMEKYLERLEKRKIELIEDKKEKIKNDNKLEELRNKYREIKVKLSKISKNSIFLCARVEYTELVYWNDYYIDNINFCIEMERYIYDYISDDEEWIAHYTIEAAYYKKKALDHKKKLEGIESERRRILRS